jgi:hypothetical protein
MLDAGMMTFYVPASSVDRWGDYPTWLAAIGTILAVVVALGLAGREGRQRRRQQERLEAELVTAWLERMGGPTVQGPEPAIIVVVNGSQQLAYKVIASLVPVRGAISDDFRQKIGRSAADFRAFKGELPPGRTNLEVEWPGGGMHIRFGVELAFRDAGGRNWIRTADGQLKRIQVEPIDHYGLNEPLPW